MAYITKKTTRNGVKPIGSNLFGLCSTASATAQKSVSMSDFNVLVSGVTIHVYFAYGNTAQNPTLSVGSTAGVAIKRNGILGGKWSNGSVISFTYDGTNWIQNDADDGSESVTYGLSLNGNQLSLVEGGQTQSVTLTDEDTTYSLSINGNVLTLTDSDGNHDDVTLPSSSDTTYTISISGHTLTLTPSSGTSQSVTLPDNDTKYGLSLSGNTISLVEGGSSQSITITDKDTTYTISISGHTLTLTPSEGTAQTITLPDNNTTYTLTQSGDNITLTGSDGSTYTVTVQGGTTLLYTKDVADTATSTNNVVQNDVDNNVASGGYALAEGYNTTASGYASHAEGRETNAEGRMSHAEGYDTTASGNFSHAEGANTIASSPEAHAEGSYTTASGYYSHAEGSGTTASGNYSHAEGKDTAASALHAHAEGEDTTASGDGSHAEGDATTASGVFSHAEGRGTVASGSDSHAGGRSTIANRAVQTVIGRNNVADTGGTSGIDYGNYVLIIGNGATENYRSNALTIDWNGNVDIASGAKYKIGGNDLSASDVGAVPTTRTVNNKALSANISLDASDVGAVPTSRTVNNKALSSDISLDASDVNALPISGGTMTGNGQIINGHITNSSSRETTPDLTPTGKRGITALLASSAMTTNRPGEGTIIHCEWDNNGGWNSQLFIADNDSGNGKPFVAVRGQRSGTWTAWDKLLSESTVTDYVTAQGTSGAWKYRKWNSGKVEAWAYISFTSTTPAVWASPIRYIDKTFTIPSGIFASAPRMTGSSNSNQYWAVDVSASSSTAGSVRFCTVASSALTPYIQIYAWTD